ncbi:MAG: AAA family ATPase [Acidobacteria bacterium]|nr:AAA family ATPase [Acidobacteriota bacterium]
METALATTPLDRFLAALPRPAQQNGGGWMARCPAHEDDRASLSITTGDDGRVLLKCHAGCQAAAITAAMSLELRDLFPPRDQHDSELTYDYRDETGAVLFQVVRFPNKQFRQRRPDGRGGWSWSLNGVRRVPYRLPDLKGREAIFIAEGEKDVENLWRVGLPATTNAGGAGKWAPEYSTLLKALGCQRVAIFPDNDAPGDAHARAVARSCHDAGLFTKIVPLAGLEQKGDVSDWLRSHTKAELLEAIRVAPPFNPGQLAAAPLKFELTTLADLLNEPDEAADWLIEERMPSGGVILLAGRPKAGKSTLARDLAFAVASGEKWLGGWRTHRCAVWYLALEDKRSEVRKHFRAMGATGCEPIRIFAGQAPNEILPALHVLAATEQPGLIVVDTLQRLIRARDFSDYADVTSRFEPLLRLSRETGATLLLLTHASTHTDRSGLDAVLGSTALTGSADNVFVLQRSDKYRTLSSVQRVGHDLEPVVLVLDESTGRVTVAGTKRNVDDRELGERLLVTLEGEAEPVAEKWFDSHVEGRNQDKGRVLRRLVGMGRVVRSGAGGHRDPYRYQLSPEGSGPRNSALSSETAKSAGTSLGPDFTDGNLDFRDEVPEVPIRNTGNLISEEPVLTPQRASDLDTECLQVPEVPEVPDSSGNCGSATLQASNGPDEMGSDLGSREPPYPPEWDIEESAR